MKTIKDYLTDRVKEKLLACDNTVDSFLLGVNEASERNLDELIYQCILSDEPQIMKDVNGWEGRTIISIPHTRKGILLDEITFRSKYNWYVAWDRCKELGGAELPTLNTGFELCRHLKKINRMMYAFGSVILPNFFWAEDYLGGLYGIKEGWKENITQLDIDSAWCWTGIEWVPSKKTDDDKAIVPIVNIF